MTAPAAPRVVVAAFGHAFGVRVDGPGGPKGLRVLRFDGACGAEGCGIAAFGGDEYKYRRRRHLKLPSEPGREAKPIPARTHGSARSARTIDPGRREAPELFCFRKYSLPAPPSAISAAAAIKKEL